ncbi:hypothetical protein AZI86_08190 [Bdellovibrio bacteriovorus]|uniref:Lipoprotein n=1 Tax=Bdellovibrio bacteriovorus TaxID=959 RepID=A0A150WR72_BDEBC|nr:hypothetical protein [Bdellovibrio bacteriovorus]KYG66992.1 hypothetical protein AZI86_08190 [Bdellovibrio bacteriovorus]
MKKIILTAASISLLLGGCGGKGGKLSAAGGTVTQAQALAIFSNQNISVAMQSLVPSGNPNAPIQMPINFAGMFDSCTTKNPETPVDNDGDGIPLSLQVKYACNGINEGASTLNRKGTYKIVDFNDESGNENMGWGGGYRYDFDFSNQYVAGHEEFKDTYDGFFEVKKTSSAIRYSSGYTGTVDGFNKNPKYFEWNWNWQSQWDNVYIPDDMSQPYQKGSAKFDGFFAVTGTMEPDQSNQQTKVKVVFKLKSTGLKYDRSCSQHWSEGSIIFLDGSNNEIRYEYSCSGSKAYFNGTEVTNSLVRL